MLKRVRILADDASTARLIMERLAEPDDQGSEALATASFLDSSLRRWQVDAYYAEHPTADILLARIGELLPADTALSIEDVPDENWVAVSQAALPPVEAGRFLVHGSHDRSRVGRRRFGIEIDAGEAFGTAHHATTQGCLEVLDRLAHRRCFGRILDLGCGSGVLAIAAARAWPRARIIASDIDPVAVSVARENARLNGTQGRVRFVAAPGLGHTTIANSGAFDLVVANILAGPLIDLAPRVARVLCQGGVLVLSGLLGEQTREVASTYRMAGFRLAALRVSHNWATLEMVKVTRSGRNPHASGRHLGAGRFESRRNLPDWSQDQ